MRIWWRSSVTLRVSASSVPLTRIFTRSRICQKDVTVLYVKDYIRKPKPNGYKSYHMVVTIPIYLTEGPVETKVEIQIRTIAQDFWASLEHKIYYKFEGSGPDSLQAELKACADMVDMLDAKMFSLNQSILETRRAQEDEPEPKE